LPLAHLEFYHGHDFLFLGPRVVDPTTPYSIRLSCIYTPFKPILCLL
jgi:hypothetical protein